MPAAAPILTEIDLSQTTRHGGAGLEAGPLYLAMAGGRFAVGRFTEVWYGLSFGGFYDAGLQYDPPTENYSPWQRVWLIENAEMILFPEAEHAYAARRRAYAIGRLTCNGQIIDDTAPLEAFLYHPTTDAMPKRHDDDEHD